MKSIDIKSFIIGILLTATVFLSTGWQTGVQKVEITRFPGFGNGIKADVKITDFPYDAVRVKTAP